MANLKRHTAAQTEEHATGQDASCTHVYLKHYTRKAPSTQRLAQPARSSHMATWRANPRAQPLRTAAGMRNESRLVSRPCHPVPFCCVHDTHTCIWRFLALSCIAHLSSVIHHLSVFFGVQGRLGWSCCSCPQSTFVVGECWVCFE